MDERQLVDFSETVEAIYAAALKPERWPTAVERIARLHGAASAALLTPSTAPRAGGFIVPFNLSERSLQTWGQKYVHEDVWNRASLERGLLRNGAAYLGDDLVPDEELTRSTFYRDFLVHEGVRWLCAGIVFDGSDADLLPTVCSVFNPPDGKRFDDLHRTLHALITRHLSLALGTMFKLRDADFRAASSLQALNRLAAPLVLLGARGQVRFVNDAAHRLFAERDGVTLSAGAANDDMGWLRATGGHRSQSELDRLVRQSLGGDIHRPEHFTLAAQVARADGRPPLMVRGSPLTGANELLGEHRVPPSAILFFVDPSARLELDVDTLTRVYALTPAECRVAREFVRGASVDSISAILGVSVATVRTHMSNLFDKTATNRQPALLKLLLAFAR